MYIKNIYIKNIKLVSHYQQMQSASFQKDKCTLFQKSSQNYILHTDGVLTTTL